MLWTDYCDSIDTATWQRPYKFDNGYECPCCGILQYRGHDFPVYIDDYGMSDFIVFGGNEIQISSLGGECD